MPAESAAAAAPESMERWAVECVDLTKRYAGVPAVDGLNLRVAPGHLYALLGRNGAGKTTTVGMLATIVAPSAGKARVDGIDVVARPAAVRARIGLVLQEPALDRYLSVTENLRFLARAYRIPGRDAGRRVEAVLDLLDLADKRDVVVGALSGGNKRRVEIAAGVLHRPSLLLLDEPTVGLDIEARRRIWDHVRTIRASGTAVILTTHYLEEADMLADTVGIMDGGRLVAQGPPERLKAAIRREVVVRLEAEPPAAALARLDPYAQVVQEGATLRLRPRSAAAERPLLAALAGESALAVRELRVGAASLDDVFLAAVGNGAAVDLPAMAPAPAGEDQG